MAYILGLYVPDVTPEQLAELEALTIEHRARAAAWGFAAAAPPVTRIGRRRRPTATPQGAARVIPFHVVQKE